MKVFDCRQIRKIDAYTIEHEPIASIDLMERAARACVSWMESRIDTDAEVMVFTGPGNNGGDGWAIARLLKDIDYQNVTVVRGSIYNPPFAKKNFDLILSIGVIDHLPDPKKGLEALKNLIKSDGRLAFWVYALEGNEFYLKLARPLRKLSVKLPKKALFILSEFNPGIDLPPSRFCSGFLV